MAKLINLIGKEFDNWLVIEKSESKSGKVYWICECIKCKNKKEIQGNHLKQGTFKKCCQEYIDSESKVCKICKKEFTPKKNTHNRKYCYECSGNNLDRASTITSIRHAIKKQLIKYKGGKCEICGYSKCIGALQFHHINALEKDFELSEKYNNGLNDIELLYKEADKCQLLCANCHAEKHTK